MRSVVPRRAMANGDTTFRNKWLLALGIWLGLCVFFLIMSAVIDVRWTPPTTGNRPDQCELLSLGGTVLEPQNTWSNVGYLLAGTLVLVFSTKPLGLAMGGLGVLALFSGFYHASLQKNPQTMDVAWIYVVLWLTLCYGAQSVLNFLRKRRIGRWVETVAIVGSVILGCLMAVWRNDVCPFDSTTAVIIFAILIFAMCFRQMYVLRTNWREIWRIWLVFLPDDPSEERNSGPLRRYIWIGLPITVLSFIFRLYDGDGKFLCLPHGMLSFIQAHACWHVLSGATLLILYDFFAWLSADERRVFGYGIAADPDLAARYPSKPMAILALLAGAAFILNGVFPGSKIVITKIGPPPNTDCHLWGFFSGFRSSL